MLVATYAFLYVCSESLIELYILAGLSIGLFVQPHIQTTVSGFKCNFRSIKVKTIVKIPYQAYLMLFKILQKRLSSKSFKVH